MTGKTCTRQPPRLGPLWKSRRPGSSAPRPFVSTRGTGVAAVVLTGLVLLAAACGNDSRAQNGRGQQERSPEEAGDHNGMMGDDGMMGRDGMGEMMRQMPDWMMSRGMMMDHSMMRDMHVIHDLLMNHENVRREVEDIPGGVRTVTTSSDAEIAKAIRAHVRQMKSRVEEGRAIRRMDPLFREIFEHHDKIEMRIEEVPGGVRVTETSSDPQVTLLIRQHARRAVSEFIESGMPRAMQPTPLPEDYPR